MAAILIVPGLGGSGPDHWQTWWQAQDSEAVRIEQEDWYVPNLKHWSARVLEALDRADRPVWLVAHSFGCLASIRAAAERPERVAGALWVAPADPDRFGVAAALPAEALAFPSVVVASSDDPWMAFTRAAHWSELWGSRLFGIGQAGHINADSGYGPWPQGRALLRELQNQQPLAVPFREDRSAGSQVPKSILI